MKKYLETKYDRFINHLKEAKDEFKEPSPIENSELMEQANLRMKKAIVWLNIKKGFYAQLLPYLNIYGSFSLKGKTMATDGKSIIFHPEFVMQQTDGAIRFVICHEILHCVSDHHRRRGKRNPTLWNYACDYAINPILGTEESCEEGFEWPQLDGKKIGLYEKKYDGMTAEDIYDDLYEEYKDKLDKIKKLLEGVQFDDVLQPGDSVPEPDGEPLQIGETDDEDEEGEQDKKDGEDGDEDGEGTDGEPGKKSKGDKEEEDPGGDPGGDPGKESKEKKEDEQEGTDGGPGIKKKSDKKGKDKKDDKEGGVRVGQKVKLMDGSEATVKKVFPNGDIEI
jgi:hypothetical protein